MSIPTDDYIFRLNEVLSLINVTVFSPHPYLIHGFFKHKRQSDPLTFDYYFARFARFLRSDLYYPQHPDVKLRCLINNNAHYSITFRYVNSLWNDMLITPSDDEEEIDVVN
jgi:hypothetical protein